MGVAAQDDSKRLYKDRQRIAPYVPIYVAELRNPRSDRRSCLLARQAATAFVTTMGNDHDALKNFERGIQVCKNAELDISKRQFKAESETDALVKEAAQSLSPDMTAL